MHDGKSGCFWLHYSTLSYTVASLFAKLLEISLQLPLTLTFFTLHLSLLIAMQRNTPSFKKFKYLSNVTYIFVLWLSKNRTINRPNDSNVNWEHKFQEQNRKTYFSKLTLVPTFLTPLTHTLQQHVQESLHSHDVKI